MAIDPRISLMGKVTDAGAAIATGQATGERFRTQGVREQILNQQAQIGQQSIQENAQAQAATQGAYMNQLATGLKSKPLDQRAAIIAQQLPFMAQMGLNPADILSQDLSDTGLDGVIAQTQPFIAAKTGVASAGQREFESLISGFSKEEQEEARRVKAGLVPRAVTKADTVVTMPDGTKRVFDEQTNTFSLPIELNEEGSQVVSTPEEQIGQKIGAEVQEVTEVGAAETDVAIDKQRRLNELALDKELAETDMTDFNVRRKTFIKQGVAAKESLPNINRMIELNDRVITGGATALTKAVTDFLGMTSGDLGEFNRRSGELVLSTIRQLGANPTEGERSFLEKIQPAVGQSNEVNSSILKDLLVIAERQSSRAKKLSANPKLDPNDLVLSEPDFLPSFNGASVSTQQTPTDVTQQTTVTTVDPITGTVDTDAYVESLFDF